MSKGWKAILFDDRTHLPYSWEKIYRSKGTASIRRTEGPYRLPFLWGTYLFCHPELTESIGDLGLDWGMSRSLEGAKQDCDEVFELIDE